MPPKGFRTITVPEDVYDYFWQEWTKRKQECAKKGIRSFSAFVTTMVYEMLDERKKKSKDQP
jgi:hypothetical protein